MRGHSHDGNAPAYLVVTKEARPPLGFSLDQRLPKRGHTHLFILTRILFHANRQVTMFPRLKNCVADQAARATTRFNQIIFLCRISSQGLVTSAGIYDQPPFQSGSVRGFPSPQLESENTAWRRTEACDSLSTTIRNGHGDN